MRMDEGVDTGPVLARRSLGIGPQETAGELLDRLAGQGADLLIPTQRGLANRHVETQPQNDTAAGYSPKLTRKQRRAERVEAQRVARQNATNKNKGIRPWILPGFARWKNIPM